LPGPAIGVPQEVIAWAMEAKRKLIAYSDATGEYVATELEHLSRIISGAYLDQGLTTTGKQRQTATRAIDQGCSHSRGIVLGFAST
jgi:hypothetical protein